MADSRDVRLVRAEVRVHLGRQQPLRRIWRYVGYDEPNYTYTPSGRELLAKLGSMSDAPYFVRCHFLLCSGDGTGQPKWGSTNVYTEDAEGHPVYSWGILDRIMDTTIEAGCVPFVEIGFMPRALSSAPPGESYQGPTAPGWRYPPTDYGRWMELARALGTHCLERYGLREISRWYWELWNEPDISYWRGSVDEYCRLYDYTVAGLTAAIPQAKIGGPGTTSPGRPAAGAFLDAFLRHCVGGTNAVTGQVGTRLDYVSFHSKGGGYGTEPDAPKKTPTMHALLDHVAAGLGIVGQFPELRGHEIVLSECDPDGWAAGSIRDNPNLLYRNTEYYAAYVASAACKLLELADERGPRVDGMLTWAFQFEDREYFAGLRTLSTNGIDKPVLNVFRLLSRLGGTRLALTCYPAGDGGAGGTSAVPDLVGIAATNESSEIQLFLASHHDDWDVRGSRKVTFRLAGLTAGRVYAVHCCRIDDRHSNAHTAWIEMGRPQPPSDLQRTRLQEAARLVTEDLGHVSGGRDCTDLSVTMPAHSVCLLTLTPA
jgi:xylan 1,4-beta-xylosidase